MKCKSGGCGKAAMKGGFPFCEGHFFALPSDMRQKIHEARRSGDGEAMAAAVIDAAAEVEAREAAMARGAWREGGGAWRKGLPDRKAPARRGH